MVSGFLKAYLPVETEIKMISTLLPGIDKRRIFLLKPLTYHGQWSFSLRIRPHNIFILHLFPTQGKYTTRIRDKKILQILGLTRTHWPYFEIAVLIIFWLLSKFKQTITLELLKKKIINEGEQSRRLISFFDTTHQTK